jgi:hypothetical protein
MSETSSNTVNIFLQFLRSFFHISLLLMVLLHGDF